MHFGVYEFYKSSVPQQSPCCTCILQLRAFRFIKFLYSIVHVYKYYIPQSNVLSRIQNFKDFADFYSTLKIFSLEIIRSSSCTAYYLQIAICSQNILFKANFRSSSKFYILENKLLHTPWNSFGVWLHHSLYIYLVCLCT